MNLTPHFTLAEMTISQTAARQQIDNAASPAIQSALTGLCAHVLEPIRAHFGPVHVSSGYRSVKLNKAIGGAPGSQHCKGEAADIMVPGVSLIDLAQWIMGNLTYDQLILEFGQWVHVSWRDGPLRQQELTARHGPHGAEYWPGLRA